VIAYKLRQGGRHILIVSLLFVALKIKSTLAAQGDKKTPVIKRHVFQSETRKNTCFNNKKTAET